MQSPSGKTWILGFARVATEIRPLAGQQCATIQSEQAPLFEFGLVPYGAVLGLGISGATTGWLVANSATNQYQPVRTTGVLLGNGGQAWRFGLSRFRVPRKSATVTIQGRTVRGLALKLCTSDPAIRIGYSRSTLIQGESTNGTCLVEFEMDRIVPRLKISEKPAS